MDLLLYTFDLNKTQAESLSSDGFYFPIFCKHYLKSNQFKSNLTLKLFFFSIQPGLTPLATSHNLNSPIFFEYMGLIPPHLLIFMLQE